MKLHTLTAALVLTGAASLQAAIVEYTSQASFLAAAWSPRVTSDFSELPAGDQGTASVPLFGATVLLQSRAQVDSLEGNPLWVSSTGNITHAVGTSATFSDRLQISSLSGFHFIAAEWFLGDFDENHVAGSVFLTFSDGSVFEVASTSQSNSFRGYISDSPLFSVRVSPADPENVAAWVTVDSLTVPEPSAVLLGGLSAVLMAATRRRSRNR